jgi:BspA type Leucine rich repeat region (6 copies)/Secretion system C-terminal sorting domain
MKKILLIFAAFIAANSIFAQNFTSGGINYSVTSATAPFTVMVTTHSSFTGAANIPSTVTNAGTTYSVTSIGIQAFYGKTGLTSVSIPASVTSIDSQAFFQCTGLTSLIIPTQLTSIGYATFFACIGLTSVSIPSSITSIGDSAFSYCTGLTSVTVNWATPLIINANVFTGVTLANVALNVPAGTVTAYDTVADNVWTNFNPISATLSNSAFNATAAINLYPNPSTGVFHFKLDNDLQIEVYNNLGQLLLSEKMISGTNTINIEDQAAGIYFLKANEGSNTSTYKIIKN